MLEAHPELAFLALNGRSAVLESKKTALGRAIRWGLLRRALSGLPAEPPASRALPAGCAVDYYVDALAAAWTAVGIARRTAVRIPAAAEVEGRGLRMEMWVPARSG